MTIYLGSDHAGFSLKESMKEYLEKRGYSVKDLGNHARVSSDDYPDYAEKVAKAIRTPADRGILFCGSGAGVCIVANKFRGIRAVVGYDTKVAKHTRQDNNSNVLCLSGRTKDKRLAKRIVDVLLNEKFSGIARHARRLKKIAPEKQRRCMLAISW